MSNHTHLRWGHLYPTTFGNNLKLADPPHPPSLPLSPCLLYIYDTPFSILHVPQPYFAPLFIFNSVSLPLALTLPLLPIYVTITLPSFVITGMFTLFPLAYSCYSAPRKWKSVWALRSDSLRVPINPLGVSDVEVSFLTKTVDHSLFLEHHRTEIDLEAHNRWYEMQEQQQWALYALYCLPRGTTTWDKMGNGTAEGKGKKKDCGQRDLIESRSGCLVTPSNQTWCHSHLISNLWRSCSRLGRGGNKKRGHCLLPGI